MFINYKRFHSTVFMAMYDAGYRFVYIDLGYFGKDNDASIIGQS